jgi:hypothetical protein
VSNDPKIPDFTHAGMPRLERVLHQELVDRPIAMGRALKAIRDQRLYREAGYPSFDAYCRERWGFGRTHATSLIRAAEAAGS